MLARGKAAGCSALLVVSILIAVAAIPALADPGDGDGTLGGPHDPVNGVAQSTLCPAGAVVTGVSGLTGLNGGFTTVDVATVDCRDSNGPVPATGTIGVPDGGETPAATACGPGEVAVGIGGNEGDFIDLLQLRCQAADLTGSKSASTGVFGGGNGTPEGPYECPAGRALTGLDGESVTFFGQPTRYVSIVCEAAAPVTTGPADPPKPPTPVLGKQLVVQKVKGTVLVAVPAGATAARAGASQKGLKFVPIEQVRVDPRRIVPRHQARHGAAHHGAQRRRDAPGRRLRRRPLPDPPVAPQARPRARRPRPQGRQLQGLHDQPEVGRRRREAQEAAGPEAARQRARALPHARALLGGHRPRHGVDRRGPLRRDADEGHARLGRRARQPAQAQHHVRAGKRTKGKGGGRGSYFARAG